MSIRNYLVALYLLVFLCMSGCGPTNGLLALSRSPDGSKQILIESNWCGDAIILLEDVHSLNTRKLIGVTFADANERIMKLSWSLDSSKFEMLITNSNRAEYIHGKRLIVFDVSEFPGRPNPIVVLDDHESDIEDYRLANNRLLYKLTGETEYRRHQFENQ